MVSCSRRIPTVIKIGVVIGNPGAVEPVDRHTGASGGGVVAGVYGSGGDKRAELAAEGGNRRAATSGDVGVILYDEVVIVDVGRDGIALAAGDEQQAETVAYIDAGGYQARV